MTGTRLDSTDPELGTVRLCRRCGETWPKDEEFFYFAADGSVMGHCRACWSDYNLVRNARRRERRAA